MRKLTLLFTVFCLGAAAQTAENPLSTGVKGLYSMAKNNLIKSAEKMPEENYSFKPTPDVRSFGQLVGHVADAGYMFCAPVLGEQPPVRGIEKSKTSKADLVQAIKDSFAYCDKAYDSMTDAKAVTMVKMFGERSLLNVLEFNVFHDYEHYGNMVTYLRLKGVVPPSSEPRK
ncbi:MAG: DinB family protein [Acidobacteria bacterium]|nr:DinB family protein [Acidobacteriota bacterium]